MHYQEPPRITKNQQKTLIISNTPAKIHQDPPRSTTTRTSKNHQEPSKTLYDNQRKIVTVKQMAGVADANAMLLGTHCRHSHAKVPRQCEADMS